MADTLSFIALTLRQAADLMETEPRMAAWLVADAGLMLREILDREAIDTVIVGYDEPTGRGAMLPSRCEMDG